MSDRHETIADIIAEKRRRADELEASSYRPHQFLRERIAELRQEANRLEAALKRELSKNVSKNGADFGQLGDAAKLREALKLCLRGMCGYCRMDAEARGMTTECVNGCEVMLDAKSALATPPRNCDNLKTSWEVLKEWHGGLATANDIVRLLDWLLSPATEGGDK